MNETLGLFLLVVVSGAGLAALLGAISLLLPGPVGRSRSALEAAPGRAFVLGLVNLVFFLALATLLVQASQAAGPIFGALLGVLAVIILAGLVALAALGLAGLVTLVRERMNQPVSPLVGMLRAAMLLEVAAVTPFIGWWLFTPAVLVISLGAGILSVVRRAPAAPAPLAPLPEA